MAVSLHRPVTCHLIYPGMTRSVPVTVLGPVTETGYTGFVWTITVANADDPDVAPVKTHVSRLSNRPVGQLSNR